jgi:hypothetical protein
MGAPRGTGQLHTFLKTGKKAYSHQKKGWEAGMSVLLFKMQSQNIKLTTNQTALLDAYQFMVPDLLVLIYDVKGKREVIRTARLGRDVEIHNAYLTQETVAWLQREWPEVTVDKKGQQAQEAQEAQSAKLSSSKPTN